MCFPGQAGLLKREPENLPRDQDHTARKQGLGVLDLGSKSTQERSLGPPRPGNSFPFKVESSDTLSPAPFPCLFP